MSPNPTPQPIPEEAGTLRMKLLPLELPLVDDERLRLLVGSTHGHHCTVCGEFYRCVDPECDGIDTEQEVCCDCGGMYG
jgi:hypothetical protein